MWWSLEEFQGSQLALKHKILRQFLKTIPFKLWFLKALHNYIKALGEICNVQLLTFPRTGLYRALGLQEVEASTFQDNRHMKVVGCQPYTPAAFTHQEIFLVLISVTA